MEKKWLTFVNMAICALIILFLIIAAGYAISRPSEIPVNTAASLKKPLPKGSFTLPAEAYSTINDTLFNLKYSPMTMQLPDLRKHLIYYGKNDRPDAKDAKPLLHLSFTGNKTTTSASPGEKMYLLYDRSVTPPQYVFSPNNQETPLWLEATAVDKEATIKVRMKNDTGQIIDEPWSHAQFTTMQKDFVRSGTPWEIGKMRVDGSLLARQKARWYGVDRFIENHGGKEYEQDLGKQRIDFGENESVYSLFVGLGDAMIWADDRWKAVKPGVDSLGYPLLVVKKIDERLMQLELWDVNGQTKILLNLLKSTEPWAPQNIMQNFKFIGSHTRSQFVFEVNGERLILSPKDWLVMTGEGWKKLNNAEEVNDYVNRKIIGVLFIFDGIVRKDDQQFLMGTLYNSSRSESKPVEIPITSAPIGKRRAEANLDKAEIPTNEEGEMQVRRPMDFAVPSTVPVHPKNPRMLDQEKANIYESN